PVALPVIVGVVVYEKPRPSAYVSKASGWAYSGSPNAQSVRLKRMDDHQSFVGTGPLGAPLVTHCRGLVAIEPQPVGVDRPAGSGQGDRVAPGGEGPGVRRSGHGEADEGHDNG